MMERGLEIDSHLVERFTSDLDTLIAPNGPIGIAVSGGPDSVALLLLAAAARPGRIEAATIDHALRPGARAEAEMVADLCRPMGVPHAILTARWEQPPETAIQERARGERYRLLGYWAEERGLSAIATAHHIEDQAETLLMRLARGAGVKGLAAMRPRGVAPGAHVRLVRPLLGWRHSELEQICADAGVTPAHDPSNDDERFERVRIRHALGEAGWLDAGAVARSANHAAEADDALKWAAELEWSRAVEERRDRIAYRPSDAPGEIVRRVVTRAIRKLATEGDRELRGSEVDRLLATLADGGTSTLRGVLCSGGRSWRFERAPPRSS
jgi:tRNA(Ile)-lysidine synthase